MSHATLSPQTDVARARLVRPSRVSYVVDVDGRIKYASVYTCALLGYREGELIGRFALGTLRPDLDEAFRLEVLHKAQEHPGEWRSFEDTYVLHDDGHRIDLHALAVRWHAGSKTLEFRAEPTAAEDDRVRAAGPQFIDPFERAAKDALIRDRQELRVALLDKLIAAAEEKLATKPEDRAVPREFRKYPRPDDLERDLHGVFDADDFDPWAMRVKDVCAALPTKISPNALTERFERFGWLRGRSLSASLKAMALDYLDRQGRGLGHLLTTGAGVAAALAIGGGCHHLDRLVAHLVTLVRI